MFIHPVVQDTHDDSIFSGNPKIDNVPFGAHPAIAKADVITCRGKQRRACDYAKFIRNQGNITVGLFGIPFALGIKPNRLKITTRRRGEPIISHAWRAYP